MPEDLSDSEQLLKANIDRSIPVVITTHNGFYNDAKVIFPNSEVIVAEKVLTGMNLEKVILLIPQNISINYHREPERLFL